VQVFGPANYASLGFDALAALRVSHICAPSDVSSGGGIGPEEFISVADRYMATARFRRRIGRDRGTLFAFWQAALRMMAYEDAGGSMCEARFAL
jgi:hypothetical protein